MDIRITPHRLSGSLRAIPSKSDAHRLLILAALAEMETFVGCPDVSRDIEATASLLRALGAGVERTEDGFLVTPVSSVPASPLTLDCHESGSTLRFLLPVAAALGVNAKFVGEGRLGERPMLPLTAALRSGGVSVSADLLPIEISGRLRPGEYELPGNISSQFISGMLMALAHLGGGSVRLTTALESSGYVDMTLRTLERFGVSVSHGGGTFAVSGRVRSPGHVDAEGDWSSAAFWQEANTFGSDVSVEGLDGASAQPDRAAARLLQTLGGTVDVSGSPDLFPALALAASAARERTVFVGGARLRLKESDRIATVAAALRALGGVCRETEDGLTVEPSPLSGGEVDGAGDHRIVMAAAVAAAHASGETVIRGAEAVEKSYPGFFEDFTHLGGIVHVL